MVWNDFNPEAIFSAPELQIISQNYVVWNSLVDAFAVKTLSCKLYHKTTWFETLSVFIKYNSRGSSCKLYHKTTWFETARATHPTLTTAQLQIISQNYVVWNTSVADSLVLWDKLQIISQNYVVWNKELGRLILGLIKLQIISQNYVVWNSAKGFNFFSARASLQIISQNYVVWNILADGETTAKRACCKLYHKTTWFETRHQWWYLARALAGLQIISQNYVVWNLTRFVCIYPHNLSQIISQNYVVWNISVFENA